VVVLVSVAAVVGTTGCSKKKKGTTTSGSTTTSIASELDAVNKDQLSRFGDEKKLPAEPGVIKQLATVRSAPNEIGTAFGVLDPEKPVLKYAEHAGYTLVAYERQPGATQKWAGWVPDAAFSTFGDMPGTGTAAAPSPGTPTVAANAPTTTAGTCTMTLRTTGFVPSAASCVFDEKVRTGPATLTYPCAGGAARASFSTHAFAGTADKSKVALSRVSTFAQGGCTWKSVQSITGTPPNLSYSYSESVASGTCKNLSPCTARATVTAQ